MAGAIEPIDHTGIILPTWVETWLYGFAKSTRNQYARALRRLMAVLKHDRGSDLDNATEADVMYAAEWFDETHAPKNDLWNQTMSAWRNAFEYMVENGRRQKSPADRLKCRQKADRIQPTPTIDQVRRLWRGLNSEKVFSNSSPGTKVRILQERAAVCLLLACGLRVAEIARLRVRQFDFEERVLRKVKRKRGREVDIAWHPKCTRHFFAVVRGMPLDAPLFPSADSMTPISSDTIRRRIKHLCRQVSIPVYTPHAFRRFVITDLANRLGIDKAKVFADHVDVKTTYGYLGDRHSRPVGDTYED